MGNKLWMGSENRKASHYINVLWEKIKTKSLIFMLGILIQFNVDLYF